MRRLTVMNVRLALTTIMVSTACGGGNGLTAPPPITRSVILVIAPATVFLQPGESVKFSALESAAAGSDFVSTSAQWSVDDGLVATVALDGTVTAQQTGHAHLVARHGHAVATHPIEVGNDAPVIWSGTYVPTSCTSDCAPCCSGSMKGVSPRPFRFLFRQIGERVVGELTLLVGYAGNERRGAIEGSPFGEAISAAPTYTLRPPFDLNVCCGQVRDWTLSPVAATGSFIEIHGDPRLPIGRSLTFTNRILAVTRGHSQGAHLSTHSAGPIARALQPRARH
jgi:Big-like domain-containing protein